MIDTVNEKRKHPRVPLEDVTVEICPTGAESDKVDICPILNISRSGLLFEAHHVYPHDQVVRLTFVLPDCMVIFRTNALIIHQFRQSPITFVGVHFDKLSRAEEQAIDQFIRRRGGISSAIQ